MRMPAPVSPAHRFEFATALGSASMWWQKALNWSDDVRAEMVAKSKIFELDYLRQQLERQVRRAAAQATPIEISEITGLDLEQVEKILSRVGA